MDLVSLNNREIAGLIWTFLIGGFVVWKARRTLVDFLGSASRNPAAWMHAGFVAYIALIVVALDRAGYWRPTLAFVAAFWTFSAGAALTYYAGTQNWRGLRTTALKAFSATVVVEVFVSLAFLSLPLELIVAPVVTFVFLLYIYTSAEEDPKTDAVESLTNRLLIFIGIVLMIFVAVTLVTDWKGVDKMDALRALALPAVLTLSAVPFLAALWAYSGHSTRASRHRLAHWLAHADSE